MAIFLSVDIQVDISVKIWHENASDLVYYYLVIVERCSLGNITSIKDGSPQELAFIVTMMKYSEILNK